MISIASLPRRSIGRRCVRSSGGTDRQDGYIFLVTQKGKNSKIPSSDFLIYTSHTLTSSFLSFFGMGLVDIPTTDLGRVSDGCRFPVPDFHEKIPAVTFDGLMMTGGLQRSQWAEGDSLDEHLGKCWKPIFVILERCGRNWKQWF